MAAWHVIYGKIQHGMDVKYDTGSHTVSDLLVTSLLVFLFGLHDSTLVCTAMGVVYAESSGFGFITSIA